MKKIVLFILVFFLILKTNAQLDSINTNKINAIRFNNIGIEYHKQKQYKKAIDYFNKAIKVDSTYADAYYNRAISLVSANPNEFIDFDKCKEFKKAMKYGKKISEEELFFYGCTLKKDLRDEEQKKKIQKKTK